VDEVAGVPGIRPIRLLVVSGSLSQKGRTAAVLAAAARVFLEELPDATSFDLNVAHSGIELMDGRPLDQYGATTRTAVEEALKATAFLIGSPMYRGGVTGALKNYLDLVPPDYMKGKVAGVVATGASHHHYLGVSLSLEPVLKFFQMHVVPSHLYVANTDNSPESAERKAQELGHALAQLACSHLPTGPGIE
jgi:NAD(P)H-dependent FMN reductase